MSGDQVEFLKMLLTLGGGTLYYNDTVDGVLIRVTHITDNLRTTQDPTEIPESGAWLANCPKYVGLLGACPEDFKFMAELAVKFPD